MKACVFILFILLMVTSAFAGSLAQWTKVSSQDGVNVYLLKSYDQVSVTISKTQLKISDLKEIDWEQLILARKSSLKLMGISDFTIASTDHSSFFEGSYQLSSQKVYFKEEIIQKNNEVYQVLSTWPEGERPKIDVGDLI